MNSIDILAEVMKYPCKNIVFTGGEPMLNDLWPLSRLLHRQRLPPLGGIERNR